MKMTSSSHVIIPAHVFAKVVDALSIGQVALQKVNPGLSDINYAIWRLSESVVKVKSETVIETVPLEFMA